MSLVNVHNEWDPLEEIIVGTMAGARIPARAIDLHTVEYAELERDQIPSGPFPSKVVEETEGELEALRDELVSMGITVRRPEKRDHSAKIKTPDWETDSFYDYCPRDGLLTVGNTVIETPMVLRSRFLEPLSYKDLMIEYFKSGAKWISAPKPRLLDSMYDLAAPAGKRLLDFEPAFDAANVLRFGTDILYLVSDSGNELGWKWLQSTLGDEYTVHPCRNLYASTHVDSTLVPLRPGLLLINPSRVSEENIPDFLRGWDRIECPELNDIGYVGDRPYCSVWIGMNLLVIGPGRVIADKRQPALIRALEKHNVEVIPMQLTHSRTLGGGFHCATLDIRRTGQLETYR
ncbi:inosamine-phosphate amidinotransferase 1 (plasmid) [Streptomyces sp. NBC_00853]|uniref:inosamine-phosphate amidinotransferase 1 n=1 Tax=Streptomyces sp. NBC_00853 TaxID=2903681 RepID=UPI002F90BD61|nr:inosamine-phosphate amidinotransferase 1 [Streptomyces sp. NBC_00853]